ncbi:SDR family NAD(P)-dependent oxidoreductase [Lacicoccus alkaliphilus]|uniref:NAD(P)-dependent dehydrogenase, short-chain alcohol dehydrogenase family n=1 Tax=Lacicoccus alkaliphilus DSM 16010 TaxID=1123231 RepID=A0A1M7AT06_9BACL|nr:SDR family NAD(P)-dependent oxidoreductase [Salinicoccus alkaliphilus]SHL45811.1 NAD(P)-dependent dehydrogenase, short-chain alcohol dehydrogenase family [Salinicoccus alkaliphilus DSM 16010]
MKRLSECTVLITGSTDGLGKAAAEWFAGKGAEVLLHGRNEDKGRRTLEDIKEATGNEELEYYNGDFSSLRSVSRAAEDIRSGGKQIDVLINNAGIGGGPKSGSARNTSEDGFELIWAVNYLAQVLFTRKLLPLLKKDARIVNVASIGQAELDFDDLNTEKSYDGFLAYARSKLALIMFTFDLAEELNDEGISVNALHPATLMDTNMVDEHFGSSQSSVAQGQEALAFLAASADLEDVTGEFYDGKNRSKVLMQAYEPESRQKLREITEDGLKEFMK